jgi:hypothetical protein
MKWLLLLVALPVLASEPVIDRVYMENGATCSVPTGFNVAPYDETWNNRGMSEFCVFPTLVWVEAIQQFLSDYVAPDLPECDTLVVSPSVQVFPCYEIRSE